MACMESIQRKQCTLDPYRIEEKSHDTSEQPQITKETLIKALEEVENEIQKPGYGKLLTRLQELRIQVEGVLENQKEEIQNLQMEIQKLKKVENEGLGKLALARTTWEWEA